MIVMSLVVLVLAATAPTAQPSPAQAPPAGGPLREVVYKVTVGSRSTAHANAYEGMTSDTHATADRGTVTVDVMGFQNDVLGVQVTELMNNKGSPYTFNGEVTGDGTVVFGGASIEDVTRELLQYFGPDFIPAGKDTVGDTWTVNYDRSGTKVQTVFTITKIDGALMTVREQQQATFASYDAKATTIGTIVLKPSLLVPISGDVQKVLTTSDVTGEKKQEISLHFERSSDTRETVPK